MKNCREFEEFSEEYGNNHAVTICEIISDNLYKHKPPHNDVVKFDYIYYNDREKLNATVSGTIRYEGMTYRFVAENGNWNGFVMVKFGLDHAGEIDIYYGPNL